MSYRLGVDIGGTFTDFVAYDEAGHALKAWKNLSTPQDPIQGILTGLRSFGEIEAIGGIRLGTTVATNALLEKKGARVAYVTTRGFRDVPFIGRGNRMHHYDLAWVKPKPFVLRRDAHEVDERIGPNGEVIEALDEAGVAALADRLAAEGAVEAVAVVLLHSYLTPDHEQRIKAIFAERLPDVPVSISYEVLPKWKEHFRSSTTLCDAFIKPVVSRQLGSMRRELDDNGIHTRVLVMRSNGGEMSLERAVENPIQIAVSGPTGGVIAAKRMAALLGLANLVTLDMGGTSTDVSTVVDGKEKFTTDFEIEWGRPIQIPMIDIRTIGAGGGSIARIDAGGMLVVGPESAGANPGPACYGRGGTLPTVTDANVVLGRISAGNFLGGGASALIDAGGMVVEGPASAGAKPGPACYGRGGTLPTVTDANVVLGRISAGNFLGGSMALDDTAARTAVAAIAKPLGLSVEDAALAIIRIANNNMVGALHTVLTEQGLDPRDFTLVAFGGAGPPHVSDLMTEASIPRGLVPNFPGQFSAFGFTMADARVDRYRTVQLNSRFFDRGRAAAAMKALVAECRAELAAQGHTDVTIQRSVEMRYLGQNYELEIPTEAEDFTEDEVAALFETFHAQHEARFGFRLADHMEIVNFLVTGIAHTGALTMPVLAEATGSAEPRSRRPVWFDRGWLETPVYDRADLLSGHHIKGPALIEETASVTVLDPGKTVSVDRYGNLMILA